MELIIGTILVFGLMYFMLVRPQSKAMRARMEAQQSLTEGSRVLLDSGFYATVNHVGQKQLVLEIAPDCLVTVARQSVLRVVNPDEEEFEFDDVDDVSELESVPESVVSDSEDASSVVESNNENKED